MFYFELAKNKLVEPKGREYQGLKARGGLILSQKRKVNKPRKTLTT
jgi:hypothetical protein